MELFASAGNPVPADGVVGAVEVADGVRLRYARWQGRAGAGTVCVIEGRGDPIERYFETVTDLRRRGFTVVVFDWRGQGGSDRRLTDRSKAHVDSFDEYDRDLAAFMEQVVLPDCPPPYFALAHSFGCLIALRCARDGSARFHRMVLIGPLIALGPTRPRQPTACRIAAAFTAFGLGEMSAHGEARETIDRVPFEGNDLTGDRRRFDRNRAIVNQVPQVSVEGPTYGWLNAACRAMRDARDPDFAPEVRVPTLMVVGSLDKVVSVSAIETFAAAMRGGGVTVIPGGLHELLMERDAIREQFFAAFDAFVPGS